MELVKAAATRLGIKMKVAVTKDEVLGPLGVNQVPSTLFLDANGVIVGAASGERSERFFRKRAASLLP